VVISLKSTESWSSRSNRSKTPVHTVQPVHGPITERPALGYSVQPVHWTGSPAGCVLHWCASASESACLKFLGQLCVHVWEAWVVCVQGDILSLGTSVQ
jgi:hypothetical protein